MSEESPTIVRRRRAMARRCTSDIGINQSSVPSTAHHRRRWYANMEVRNAPLLSGLQHDFCSSRKNASIPKSKAALKWLRKSNKVWSREMTLINEKCRMLRHNNVLSEIVEQQDDQLLKNQKENEEMKMIMKRQQEEIELLKRQMNDREEVWKEEKKDLVNTIKLQHEKIIVLSSALDQSKMACDEHVKELSLMNVQTNFIRSKLKKSEIEASKSKEALYTLSRQLSYEEEERDRAQLLLEEQQDLVKDLKSRLDEEKWRSRMQEEKNAILNMERRNQERAILFGTKAMQILQLNTQNKVEKLKSEVATSKWSRSTKRKSQLLTNIDGFNEIVESTKKYFQAVTSVPVER